MICVKKIDESSQNDEQKYEYGQLKTEAYV